MPIPSSRKIIIPNFRDLDLEEQENWRIFNNWQSQTLPGGSDLFFHQTLVSAQNNLNIPVPTKNDYNHIRVEWAGYYTAGGGAQAAFNAQFNGDNNPHYNFTFVYALTGGAPATFDSVGANQGQIGALSDGSIIGSSGTFTVHNVNNTAMLVTWTFSTVAYASTSRICENGGGVWTSPNVVTSILLTPGTSTLAVGSTFSAYGVF